MNVLFIILLILLLLKKLLTKYWTNFKTFRADIDLNY